MEPCDLVVAIDIRVCMFELAPIMISVH